LRQHIKANEPPLAPSLQAELFDAYLSGMSCEDLAKNNKGLRLGAIVRACEEGQWYEKRQEYVTRLLAGVRERAQQATASSVSFLAQALAMMEKKYGTKIARFLQTGDEADLGDLKDWGLHQYKQLMELFLKVTGQDGTKRVHIGVQGSVSHSGKVQHEGKVEMSPMPASPVNAGPPSPADATALLQMLHERFPS
jgi:hypothetical protein